MEAINLIEESEHLRSKAIEKIRSYEDFSEKHPKFKIGDVIEFFSGFNNHILYKSEILGFDEEGKIYVLWDCYWVGIKDNKITNIKKITKMTTCIRQLNQMAKRLWKWLSKS